MSGLPKFKWNTTSATQQQKLAAWFRAWSMDLRLRESCGREETKASSNRMNIGQSVSPFAPEPPGAGQIRLLSSSVFPRAGRPVYAAILADQANEFRLAAPYGRFSQPAFEGELRTTREEPALSVLCLWNACLCPSRLLAKSWLVGTLTDQEMAEALAVLDHVKSGKQIPAKLMDRVGLPILRNDDPRLTYRMQEEALTASQQAVLSALTAIAYRIHGLTHPITLAEAEKFFGKAPPYVGKKAPEKK
jgi:hypothetical protein